MRYVVADTETNGLFDYSKAADADGQPRMAQLALVYLTEALEIERTESFLIKPEGWVMDDTGEACKVHGLTHARLMAEGVPVGPVLRAYNTALDNGRVVVGYNVSYDLKIMRAEMRRAGLPDRYETTAKVDVIHKMARLITNKTRGKYKTHKLGAAYEHLFGKPFDGAHDALADAKATAQMFQHLVGEKYYTPEELTGVKAL